MKFPNSRAMSSWTGMAALGAAVLVTAGVLTAPAQAQKKSASKTTTAAAPAASPYQDAVNAAYAKFKDLKEGKNADYIPALA